MFLPHRQIENIEFYIEKSMCCLCAYDTMWFKCHVMLFLLQMVHTYYKFKQLQRMTWCFKIAHYFLALNI